MASNGSQHLIAPRPDVVLKGRAFQAQEDPGLFNASCVLPPPPLFADAGVCMAIVALFLAPLIAIALY